MIIIKIGKLFAGSSLSVMQSNRNSIEKRNEVAAFGVHKARWITISLDEYESMKSTLEVLSDQELMEQIKESRVDFKTGNFKKQKIGKLLY
jgi:PHD/YefM family antitoxin component YafN of YafNO toxin-antitoxin module